MLGHDNPVNILSSHSTNIWWKQYSLYVDTGVFASESFENTAEASFFNESSRSVN